MVNYSHFAGIESLFGCTEGSDCTIGLKSHDNKYVGSTNSGEADANRPKFRAYEKFSVTFLDGEDEGKVAFKSYQGKYLVAENTGKVNCNRDNLGSYEKWTVADEGSGLSFKSVHGKYLVAENNGDLNANRDNVGSFEIFEVVHLDE